MNKCKIVVISGATASGKSELAYKIANSLDGIVINADSIQLYKNLPILSAQPNQEEQKSVNHRLYSILSPYEQNDVFTWLQKAKKEIDDSFSLNKVPIVVGGTGMYISRLINGINNLPSTDENLRNDLTKIYDNIGYDNFYRMVKSIDPESLITIEKNDKQRLIRIYEIYKLSGQKASQLKKLPNMFFYERKNIFHINIIPNRELLYKRYEDRFKNIFDSVIIEVQSFIKNYPDIFEKYYPIQNTIGLLEIKKYLDNSFSYDETVYFSVKKIKNYAKRQFTWFKNQFKDVDFLLDHVPNMEDIKIIINKISE